MRIFGTSAIIVISLIIFSYEASAQEIAQWKPTYSTALIDCTSVQTLCIKLHRIDIYWTPNDSGSYEEWRVLYKVSSRKASYHFSVKDNLWSSLRSFYPNKKFCISKETANFLISVGGTEDDQWPNSDDPLPKLSIRVYNGCSGPVTGPVDYNGMEIKIGKWSSDSKRYAEYVFRASFE